MSLFYLFFSPSKLETKTNNAQQCNTRAYDEKKPQRNYQLHDRSVRHGQYSDISLLSRPFRNSTIDMTNIKINNN